MKTADAVKEILAANEWGTTRLSQEMNDRLEDGAKKITPQIVSNRLRQNSLSVSKLNEMLKALGYKTVIVPRDDRLPDGGYRIE